ncbi:MAG: Nif3-like dinuclear metal center hexameric protein [Candidatus Zophobacter franzmannii]|nr:Nif3-like dinuclear metal center hexameric protein [Candidatus Zophobacter franzmannii]
MPTIKDILNKMNVLAPTQIAYSWDNVGLMLGDPNWEVKKILLTLDVTPNAIKKAIDAGVDLIIAHHPFIFRPIKSVTDPKFISLIENRIGVISFHTNLDLVVGGVNTSLAKALGLTDWQPLATESGTEWLKFEMSIPEIHLDLMKEAINNAGGGRIGDYDNCSTTWDANVHFRPLKGSNPYSGTQGVISNNKVVKFTFMIEAFRRFSIESVIKSVHPYEQPGYTITKVENPVPTYSLGVIGKLEKPIPMNAFAKFVKAELSAPSVKLWPAGKDADTLISTVAVCGGSGTSVLGKAIGRADLLVTADLTYHTILDSPLPLIDAGHLYTEYPVLKSLENYLAEDTLEFSYLSLTEHEYSELRDI